MEDSLTPKQVAQALQVSESSIKRWCDRGVIETCKTGGGHRRISIDALMAFLELTNRQLTDPSAIGIVRRPTATWPSSSETEAPRKFSPEEIRTRQNFEDALIRGDERECRRIMIGWYSACESFATVADELVTSTFHQIGKLWDRGEIEIFQERRGCEIATRLIHEFRRLILEPLPSAPVALGGTTPNDHYSLPGQLVEVVLREAGWIATNIGTNLPFETLLSAAKRERPQMVWVAISHVVNEDRFISSFNAFAAMLPTGTNLVIGGRAITERMVKELQFTTKCDCMIGLARIAAQLRTCEQRLSMA